MKVLKFSAKWCNPCKMLSKVLEDYNGEIPVEEIDIEDNSDMANQYSIRGVPTCVLLNDSDVEVNRKVGMMTLEQFEQFVESN